MKVRLVEGHFPISGAVTPSDVVGRRDAIEDLVARIRSGQPVFVAGPRRIGKTSVVGAALHEARQEGVLPIEIEFFHLTTAASFAGALFDACAEAMGAPHGLLERLRGGGRTHVEVTYRAALGPLFEVALRLKEALPQPEELLNQALTAPARLAEAKSTRVALLMDEFQAAGQVHSDFYRILRHFVADTQARVSYVFSGSRASMLRNLFTDRNQPLYRAALEVPLADPTSSEWAPYLERKLREVGIQAAPECLEEILIATGGHAQDTMIVASELYLEMYRRQRHFAGQPEARAAVAAALLRLQTAFDAEWAQYQRGERISLTRLATGERVFGQLLPAEREAVRGALLRLQKDEIIIKEDRGVYHLREPLFGEYLRRTV